MSALRPIPVVQAYRIGGKSRLQPRLNIAPLLRLTLKTDTQPVSCRTRTQRRFLFAQTDEKRIAEQTLVKDVCCLEPSPCLRVMGHAFDKLAQMVF